MNTVTLTREKLHALASAAGGFSRKQIELLGCGWPVSKGWLLALSGKEIPVETYELVRAACKKKGKKVDARAPQPSLFAMKAPARTESAPPQVAAKALYPVTIHTDGGCSRNPGGDGSFAAVLSAPGVPEKWICGYIPEPTTNNRAEWAAIIEGLGKLRRPCQVTIISDSMICVNAVNGVGKKAEKRGNQDLVRTFGVAAAGHNVTAKWVRGHAGDANNSLCDRLCRRTMGTKENPSPQYSSPRKIDTSAFAF